MREMIKGKDMTELERKRILKEWKSKGALPVKGFKNHLIKPDGEVLNIDEMKRVNGNACETKGSIVFRLKTGFKTSYGKDVYKFATGHILMAQTFLGYEKKSKHSIQFRDNDTFNIKLSNLFLINYKQANHTKPSVESVKKKYNQPKSYEGSPDISWMGAGETIYA